MQLYARTFSTRSKNIDICLVCLILFRYIENLAINIVRLYGKLCAYAFLHKVEKYL